MCLQVEDINQRNRRLRLHLCLCGVFCLHFLMCKNHDTYANTARHQNQSKIVHKSQITNTQITSPRPEQTKNTQKSFSSIIKKPELQPRPRPSSSQLSSPQLSSKRYQFSYYRQRESETKNPMHHVLTMPSFPFFWPYLHLHIHLSLSLAYFPPHSKEEDIQTQ